MSRNSDTSISMLQGMRRRDPHQWERFADLYSALVYDWCRRAGISQSDSADVVQEVFRGVAEKIDDFRRDRPEDSFRGWLWKITRFKAIDHFRRSARQPMATGGSTAHVTINQFPDQLPKQQNEDTHRNDSRMIYRRALELLKADFATHTWQAFWKTTVEDGRVNDIAAELGMTVGAVYNARYKVLKRLREEFDDLDEFIPDERA